MNPLSIVCIASIETITSSPGCKFSPARRCLSFFRPWVATVFVNILSFRSRLQASLDSASITVTSHSVKFIVHQNCYQFRTSTLTYVREELAIRQGIRFHSYAQRPSRRSLWCMCSPWHSCDRSRQSCYPPQVTLRPRSVFWLCAPIF